MKIFKVQEKDDADRCDELLTMLILDEKKYDDNINEEFFVSEWYSTTLDDDERITFVAKEGEKVIGFIHGFIKDKAGITVKDTVVMLEAIFVLEEYRRKGIGKELIKVFKEWSILKGAKYIDLNVLNDNYAAMKLYEESGLLKFKTQMRGLTTKL